MKSFLLHSCVILYFLSFSHASSLEGSRDSYYTLINKAELSIVNGNYLNAKKLYTKAFKKNTFNFSDDIFNALKVSEILGDSLGVNIFAAELYNRGLCQEFFDNLSLTPKINLETDIQRKEEYRFKLEDIHNKDQDIRYSNASRSEIREVDSLNFVRFLELITIYGAPNELNIGIECSINNKGIAPHPLSTVLLHFAQQRFSGIESRLDYLVKNHVINPYEYGHYMAPTGQDVPFYVSPIIIIDKKYYTDKLSKSVRSKVNRKRNKYGLASLEEQIKKIEFKLNNSKSDFFRFYTPIDQYDGLSDEIVEEHFIEFEFKK